MENHGRPNYYTVIGDLDYFPDPADVIAFLLALDSLIDTPNIAPPMTGTQDSVYDPGNPAVHP